MATAGACASELGLIPDRHADMARLATAAASSARVRMATAAASSERVRTSAVEALFAGCSNDPPVPSCKQEGTKMCSHTDCSAWLGCPTC